MIPGVTCAKCVFWEHQEWIERGDGIRVGKCRRHSPRAIQGRDGRIHANFPLVHEQEWCGDHLLGDVAIKESGEAA